MEMNLLCKQSDTIVSSHAKAQAKTLHDQIFENHGVCLACTLLNRMAYQLSNKRLNKQILSYGMIEDAFSQTTKSILNN